MSEMKLKQWTSIMNKLMRFHVHQCHVSRQMNFWSSFKFINALWIKKFIFNSKRILLIIYGNYKESCENFWFCLFLSSSFYGVAIKTFDLVYLFHFVYEAAIKTHWLCCFVVLSLSTSQLLYCVKFKYHL